MSYKVMDWKSKLFDELVSRSTFLALAFLTPLFFVDLSAENSKAYIVLAGLSLGTGIAKTVQNTVKARKEG